MKHGGVAWLLRSVNRKGIAVMASVLQFAPRTEPRPHGAIEDGREAQIIIFPGVRYERPQSMMRKEPASCQASPLTEQPAQRR